MSTETKFTNIVYRPYMYQCKVCDVTVYASSFEEIEHNEKSCPIHLAAKYASYRSGSRKEFKVPRKNHIRYICQNCGHNSKSVMLKCDKCKSDEVRRETWYE